VKLNGILGCKLLSKNADTAQQPQPDDPNPNTAESMLKNGHLQPLHNGFTLSDNFFHCLQRCKPNLQCEPVRGSELPRGMALVTRMAALQANMRGIQWHP